MSLKNVSIQDVLSKEKEDDIIVSELNLEGILDSLEFENEERK